MVNPSQPRLRVGLLLDDFVQPLWIARIVEALAHSTAVELTLVVLNDAPAPPRIRFARARSWIRNWHYLLYAVYLQFDRLWFKVPNGPFAVSDIEPLLTGVPVVRVRPRMTKHCDYFEEADVQTMLDHDLDVAVRFGFRIIKGDALRIARYGVWSYHHGDNLVNRGGPAGFWEVMEDADVTGSVLQRLTEELDNGQVLYRSFSPTSRFSVAKNQADLFWSSTTVLPRVLEDLHRHGPTVLEECDGRSSWHAYSNRLYVVPKNREMARLLARLARRYLAERLRNTLAFDQWFVAFRTRREAPAGVSVPDSGYYRFTKLIPPPDRFWADPFVAEHEGRRFVFVEEFLYRANRGHVSVFEIDPAGKAIGPVPVLERDYHLSYPFVFEWEGSHYMIPETHANRQIELFRADRFPYEWVFDRVLIPDIRAVDATLAQIDNRWWLFASVASSPGMPWNDLWLFHAQTPLGPWTPHRRNPVKSDTRTARPAGRPFAWRGKLYRPAQDCSRRYGHSIVINEIRRIDPAEFWETEVSRISPNWTDGLLATHTINASNTVTVIDGLRSRLGRPR